MLTYFGAIYEMKWKTIGTCEHSISSHQLVLLVLYNPGPVIDGDGCERAVKCDYWRIWSNQKSNATFHDKALRDIGLHYINSGKVPGLAHVIVWSNGQRSQYKGEKNFGRIVEWPNSVDDKRKWSSNCSITFLFHTTRRVHRTTRERILDGQ